MSEPSRQPPEAETVLKSWASLHTEDRPALPPPPAVGGLPQVPGYETLAVLGQGGMGVVYQARHHKLQRLVALKMVRAAGIAGVEDLLRLRTEAEAIARLQHANIVQIFEVGAHQGLPFLALEYCAGGALDRKLAGTPLPPREAAALLEQLARAMHAAHAKGIVHRDLKPANVLLAEDGTPKVTDFGLARKLDEAGQTAAGAVLGTPSYMAPEQAHGQGQPPGPACDIYALGAILYECLTGRPPFRAASAVETVMQVLESEPVPPAALNRRVPRDLETVCLTCLHKEPARRYATALDLAEDLRRFLAGEPIRARPVGPLGRLTKWARRRPAVAALSGALLAATLLLIAALVVGNVLTTDALGQAREAEQAAASAAEAERKAAGEERLAKETAQKRLRQIEKANELLASIFRDLDPRLEEKGGPPLSAQLGERLDRAAELLEGDAVGDPLTVARLQMWLGLSQLNLGYPKRALALFTRARRVLEVELGPDDPDTLAAVNNLAMAHQEDGRLDQALPLHEEALAKRRAKLGSDHPDTLTSMNNLAMAYRADGQLAKALPLLERVLEKRRARLGPDHHDTLTCLSNLALTCWADGQLARALPLLEQTLAKMEANLGPDHPDSLQSLNNLGVAFLADGQLARAVAVLEQTLAKRKARLGPDHPDTLTTTNNLALAYRDTGRLPEALALYEQTLAKCRVKLAPDHPDTLQTMSNLGMACLDAGQVDRAVTLLEQALEKRQAKWGPDHPDTLTTLNNLGMAYRADRQHARALPLLEQALEKRKARLGPDHPDTLSSLSNLAVLYHDAKQQSRALPLFEQVLEKRKARLGPDHPDTLSSMSNLGMAYRADGKLARALPLLEQALEKRKATLGPDHPDTLASLSNLAEVYFQTQRFADAEPLLDLWVVWQRPRLPADDLGVAYNLSLLGQCQIMRQNPVAAEKSLRDSVAIFEKKQPKAVLRHHTESVLGAALAQQKKYGEAEPHLLRSANSLKADAARLTPPFYELLLGTVRRVIDLYDAWDRPDDAARWRKELEALKKSTPEGPP